MTHHPFPTAGTTRFLENEYATFAIQNGRIIGLMLHNNDTWICNEEAAFTDGGGHSIHLGPEDFIAYANVLL